MSVVNPRELLARLYAAALDAVEPEMLVRRYFASERGALSGLGRIGIFAAGKAALAMARGVPAGISRERLIVVPRGAIDSRATRGEIRFSSHPEPDRSSVVAAREALDFFRSFGPDDLVVSLISGGTSSLLCLPAAGLTLAEKRLRLRRAAREGWPIDRLNALRTRLSRVKGGRLAEATRARVVTLVLSDVPGRDFRIVGSGPTISRRKKHDASHSLGENRTGLEAAAEEAKRRGLPIRIERRVISGEAREEGTGFARRLKRLSEGGRGALFSGGEATVRLGPRAGKGGRSLEFALAAALELDGTPGVVLLAAGSDGIDGSSRFAGAFVDGGTASAARARGLDPVGHLARHDSDAFFRAAGGGFEPGPTGTNVADWAFGIYGIG